MPDGVRNLFRAALVIFVLTVVIGILNGIDAWEVPRDILLTHVHSGTLGWITLSVFGAAIWMLAAPGEKTGPMANFSIVALSVYILAFGSVEYLNSSVQRPIGGTLALIAMVWVFAWALRSRRGKGYDVAQFGMVLSLLFLVIGAVIGVLLGLQLAGAQIVDPSAAERLYSSHPGAMVVGYVVLAAVALIEWLIQARVPKLTESKSGAIEMLLFFLAGVALVCAFLLDIEPLLFVATPLQLIGTVILLVRHRSRIGPSHWGPGVEPKFVRTAVVGLIVVIALIGYLVSKISGDPVFEEIAPVFISLNHTNYLLVMTMLIFGLMARGSQVSDRANVVIWAGTTVGTVGFVLGILTESAILKRIFTPILGLALLHGIFTYLRARPKEAVPSPMNESV